MFTEQLEDSHEHKQAVRIVCNMYLRMRMHSDNDRCFYCNYMRNTKLVAKWLLPEETIKTYSWIDHEAPDVCSSCYYNFGTTPGGRLREGCFRCQNARDAISGYEIQQLSQILCIGYKMIEYYFSLAILERGEQDAAASRT